MAYEFARTLLERADGFVQRQKAIRVALRLGMPLIEIEQCLDRCDRNRRERSRELKKDPQGPPSRLPGRYATAGGRLQADGGRS